MENQGKYELIGFEKMMANLCLQGNFNVMATCFVESDSLKSPITDELFERMLAFMAKRHPFMRASLVNKKQENKMFLSLMDEQEALKKIKYERVQCGAECLRDKLIEQSAKFIVDLFHANEDSLLWRAQLIAYNNDPTRLQYVVNLVLFIAITDGLNSTTLAIEMVNILNALLTGQECKEMTQTLEPTENLYVYCEKTNLYQADFKHNIEKYNSTLEEKLRLPESFRTSEAGFKLDLFKLDKNVTRDLIDACKANNVRLTAYFYTALYYALNQLYTENEQKMPVELVFNFPASLRVRYRPELAFEHCRMHITGNSFQTDADSFGKFVDFWADCKHIDDKIKEVTSVESGLLFSVTHLFDELDEFNSLFDDSKPADELEHMVSNSFVADLSLSNLGAFVNNCVRVSPAGPFRIAEIYCSDSLLFNASPAIISHILYWRGAMMIQFGANKSLIATTYIDRFICLFKSKIYETSRNS